MKPNESIGRIAPALVELLGEPSTVHLYFDELPCALIDSTIQALTRAGCELLKRHKRHWHFNAQCWSWDSEIAVGRVALHLRTWEPPDG